RSRLGFVPLLRLRRSLASQHRARLGPVRSCAHSDEPWWHRSLPARDSYRPFREEFSPGEWCRGRYRQSGSAAFPVTPETPIENGGDNSSEFRGKKSASITLFIVSPVIGCFGYDC